MPGTARHIVLRDSTLREALDTPGVSFSPQQKLDIARALDAAGVGEAEVVAPSRVSADLEFARLLRGEKLALRATGLVYAAGADRAREVAEAAACLDHIDLLVPVAAGRAPHEPAEKIRLARESVAGAVAAGADAGAGFPHATRCDATLLLEIAEAAAAAGATRIVVYDTNGSADPFAVRELVARVCARVPGVPVWFHGHDDLGLATANALAAVLGGAAGLDVTVNGLGDRAGNASLEQAAMVLHLNGIGTGVRLDALRALSALVAAASGIPVPPLSPVVGEFALWHKSPSHLRIPGLFEAFDPALILGQRKIDE